MMRVAQIDRFGGPDVFKLTDIPKPVPGTGEILVRSGAIGVNFAETLMRKNKYAATPELPAILGSEVAGTVEQIGPGVSCIDVGTRVAAPLFAAGRLVGAYAEYVVIDANIAVPLPNGLPFEEATALMVQGLTASLLLKQTPPRGRSVLINAAAGGVGTLLIQLAKHSGAKTVIAAASTSHKLEFARSLGADICINYSEENWPDELLTANSGAGPDIIYESVGGSVTEISLKILAPSGEMVIYGALNIQNFKFGVPELLGLIFKNQAIKGFSITNMLTPQILRNDLTHLFDLALQGQLKVQLGGIYSLKQVGDAHAAIEGRQTMGKIILRP